MAAPVSAAISVDQELETWLKELGLCDSFKLNSKLLLTPEAHLVTDEIKGWIGSLGIKKAFNLAGILMLYSGPRRSIIYSILKATSVKHKRNHARAISIVKNGDYSLLDQTRIGKKLGQYNNLEDGIFEHVQNVIITEKVDPDIIVKQKEIAQEQADIIMGFASAALIFASRGNVETIVSGAALNKVFYLFELPALMANKKIKRINGVKIDEFRKIYYSGDKDAAYQTFQKICESEVELLHKKAKACGMRKNALPWRRYNIQSQLWQAEKKEALTMKVA